MRIIKILRSIYEKATSVGYGTCGKCKRSWKYVKPHVTSYSTSRGCFPLCETCWTELETPAARMPYYKTLWLSWGGEDSGVEWRTFRFAVLIECKWNE